LADFEERIKEIDALYNKATKEADYQEVEERAQALEKEMIEAGKGIDETAKAIMNGFWARYYLAKKFGYIDSVICSRVESYYSQVENLEVRIAYGYLLAVIISELREDFNAAKKINDDVRKLAESTGNVTSILRAINARGLNEMKEKNFAKAVEIFDEIEKIVEIPSESFQHAGNVVNNRGAAQIRGEVDILAGIGDLIAAAEYYLKVKPVPLKHIEGIKNRLNEAGEKLIEQAKKLE
jgi:hypothetical protein